MSRSTFLKKNVSGQGCSEYPKHAYYFQLGFFFEKAPLWDSVWKYDIARQVAGENAIFG
jgi:hypothetical protein